MNHPNRQPGQQPDKDSLARLPLSRQRRSGVTVAAAMLAVSLCASTAWAQPGGRGGAKPRPVSGAAAKKPGDSIISLSPTVRTLLTDKLLGASERRAMIVFHGQAEALANLTPAEQAATAMQRGDLNHPSLRHPSVPLLLRARAAVQRGEFAAAKTLLENETSFEGMYLRAQALDFTGRPAASARLIRTLLNRATEKDVTSAAELAAVALATAELARNEAGASKAFQSAMDLLGKSRNEVDKLYYPAIVAQAALLAEKNEPKRAIETAVEALSYNPKNTQAWLLMGEVFVSIYDFANASKCLKQIREICPVSVWADLLEAQLLVQERDPDAALTMLTPALMRYPYQPRLRAVHAAALAMKYRETDLARALDAFALLHPNHPMAEYVVGSSLAQARQYDDAETHLRRAVAMRPNWADPRIALGLLLMSAAREEDALIELQRAVEVDQYNQRALNQLKLVRELLSYRKIETEHFTIRYRAGVDEALALDMPAVLEQVYRDITATFQHKPRRKTLIELMPDEQWFGVRMTGMPSIWTIGASTGDLVAFTPPRQGAKQRGTFDWARVLRHEFVHTVTLDQTNNRVPHWFTEACAVSQEPGGREYSTYVLLAGALAGNKLFPLEAINWAFIRPTSPTDRPLAYAQAHWMFEYITATYGNDAIIRMLTLYGRGVSDADTFRIVTGKAPSQFMSEFKRWAGEQVKRWGLTPPLIDAAIKPLLDAKPEKVSIEALDAQLAIHPDHAELLRQRAEAAVLREDAQSARDAVLRYAAVRPVDPWPDQMMIRFAISAGRTQDAIAPLEQLDNNEQISGDYAAQLSRIHQAMHNIPAALSAAQRAVYREPYNAAFRELAATINLQAKNEEAALHHIRALTILQPTNPLHFRRLGTLLGRMGRASESAEAIAKADQLSRPAPATAPAPDTQPH